MYCSFCSFIQSHRESSTTIVFIILYNISKNAFCRIFQDLYVFGCKKYLINRRSRGAAIILDFALMVSFAVFASDTVYGNYGVDPFTVTASKGQNIERLIDRIEVINIKKIPSDPISAYFLGFHLSMDQPYGVSGELLKYTWNSWS